MLVITRRVGQTIHVGQDVVVSISRVKGGQVRVAIQAPREWKVVRGELLQPKAEMITA